MFYVDTSVLVAALTNEELTAKAQSWLSKQKADELAISGWVNTEVSSALSMKVRTGALSVAQRAQVLAAWQRLQAQNFHVISVNSNHFNVAARFVDQEQSGLRAADALHLAIAATSGYTLATLDRQLATAGTRLGVPTLIPK